jgi:hypothetical protein
MANLRDVVIDCEHPASLARFWAAVLNGYSVAPYDDAEIERLRAMGIDDVEDDPGVIVEGPLGSPRFYFQLVPEPKVGKNRVHLDLWANDRDAEVARLVALGATRLERQPESGEWVVLADPEGNELCIVPRPS